MYPFVLIAGAVALYFFTVALQRPRLSVILAAVLWAVYAVYEYYVANGTLCDANCNIRVDLLLVWPLLVIATLYAANSTGQRSAIRKILGMVGLVLLVMLVAPLAYVALFGFPADMQPGTTSQPSRK